MTTRSSAYEGGFELSLLGSALAICSGLLDKFGYVRPSVGQHDIYYRSAAPGEELVPAIKVTQNAPNPEVERVPCRGRCQRSRGHRVVWSDVSIVLWSLISTVGRPSS